VGQVCNRLSGLAKRAVERRLQTGAQDAILPHRAAEPQLKRLLTRAALLEGVRSKIIAVNRETRI
jgi:hypothetical protein